MMRSLVARLASELKQLEVQIAEIDTMIAGKADDHEACQRLMAIPGIGPITATAIVSAVGNGAEFRKGRGFSAWLGLTPAEYSTGGKQKLLGISKRGNGYLRKLLVHGARSVMQCREKQAPGLRTWLGQLVSRSHPNVVTIALANKMARMAWALLAKGETYRPALMEAASAQLVA
jgi:transposase